MFAVVGVTHAVESPITALTFSPDGASIVACSQSGIHVFDFSELKKLKTISAEATNLNCLGFSPDGKQLAVGGGNPSEEGIVEIFSWPDGKSTAKLVEHNDSVRSIAWLDNKSLYSASLDRTIIQWDLKRNKSVQTLKGHSRGVSRLCLLQDKKLLISSGADQSVRVWDLESGKLVRSLNQHTKPIHALAVRPAEGGLPMVASAAGDRTIRFWQPSIGRMVRYVRLETVPLNIAWIDGNRLAASCVDGSVQLVNANEVKVINTFPAIKGWAYAIAVHPKYDGIVVAGADGQIRKIAVISAKKPDKRK
jgi:WD40 repeat protein